MDGWCSADKELLKEGRMLKDQVSGSQTQLVDFLKYVLKYQGFLHMEAKSFK